MEPNGDSGEPLHRAPSQSAQQRPPTRGILKAPTPSLETAEKSHLTWDEANLVTNEGQRDATMKITEPKTPFVRYNPETDEVLNLETIPGFELGMPENSAELRSPSGSSGPSSRHSSFSAHSRPSGSRRSSSDSSEKRVDIILDENAQHGGIDPDANSDEEASWTEEERAKHRQFANRRGSHYRNEAEAMKRAQALMAQEEEDSAIVDDDDDDAMDQDAPQANGINGGPHLPSR